MSLSQPHSFDIPEETVRVARDAFPKGNTYMTMRDELGPLFSDGDFVALFSPQGQAGESPAVLAMVLAQVMSGQVTAVVLTPIAVAAAQQVDADPRSMAMAVALGCGMVFMTPMSHPVNVFVMGPGGYRFRDFVRVGLPLTLVLSLAVLVLLPIFWPLG